MSERTDDRMAGMADEAKGKAKEGLGKLTGDDDAQAEGQLDQATGKVTQGLADTKDKINDAVNGLTD